jgi:hypothetical protein
MFIIISISAPGMGPVDTIYYFTIQYDKFTLTFTKIQIQLWYLRHVLMNNNVKNNKTLVFIVCF